jgi:hypothetical protein
MKINQYGVLFQPSLIRNLKHSMSFNCHYTFGIGAHISAIGSNQQIARYRSGRDLGCDRISGSIDDVHTSSATYTTVPVALKATLIGSSKPNSRTTTVNKSITSTELLNG